MAVSLLAGNLHGFEHLVCLGEVVGLVIDAELVEAAYRSVAGGGRG
jgi:hypothetical protein